jgi:hypothetical protein
MSFRVSVKANGSLKFRVRLCPNGSRQEKGVDYDDSYSPTLKKETVIMLLHVTGSRDWDLWHVDIGCAYKEAIPSERRPMFMKMAKDVMVYDFSDREFVQLLSNYWGTKDAGRRFYAYLAFVLLDFGLVRSGDDPCLFVEVSSEGKQVLALLYVDDIAVTGDWAERVAGLLDHLRDNFAKIKC